MGYGIDLMLHNAIRLATFILMALTIAELSQMTLGLLQIEHVNKMIGTMSILSSTLHLSAFVTSWITMVTIRESLVHEPKESSEPQ